MPTLPHRTVRPVLLALPLIVAGPLAANAQTLWNEGTQGDLSGDRLHPTGVSLNLGDNRLIATTQSGDLEYLTFSIPTGKELSHLYVDSYSSSDGKAFFGIQQGSTLTVAANPPPAPSALLGYSHFGNNAAGATVGSDFLALVGTGFGAQGFTPPLQANTYTVWIQQLGTATNYQLDFVISAVPEPAETTAAVAGLLVAGAVMRSARRSRA